MAVATTSFRIVTESFEGPFDLLLFFIERDDLDIYDIPISKITDDFLMYLDAQEELDIDVASEFILVAAKLMRIKAKMLLPRREKDEFGQEIDPRQELVNKLLEYKSFKESLNEFKIREEARMHMHDRGGLTQDLNAIAQKALVDIELESLSLTSLFTAYRRLMREVQRRESKVVHRIVKYPYTIATQRNYIFDSLKANKKVTFDTIFAPMTDRMEAIVTFLAVLEMLNQQLIGITLGRHKNNFWIRRLS